MERIFEPFFTTKEDGKGTGLGLAMVHGTIMQHQGFIEVNSVHGGGTTFRIYLGLLESAEILDQKQTEQHVFLEKPQKQTILVVEDEESVRNLMVMALTSIGYQVMCAENGRQAVELFRERRDVISLILMDVVMPEMSGEEALDQMRKIHPDIPCMFMTGYGADVLNIRDVAVIRKPFNLPDLLIKVRLLLDQAKAAAPGS
jgi:CheY-like chemotaxis protein